MSGARGEGSAEIHDGRPPGRTLSGWFSAKSCYDARFGRRDDSTVRQILFAADRDRRRAGVRRLARGRHSPPPHATLARDIALAADTTLVSARVAAGRHAGLDPAGARCRRRRRRGARGARRRGLRSAESARRAVVPSWSGRLTACCAGFEYEIDADRLLRVVRSGPEADAGLVADVAADPENPARRRRCAASIDRAHSSLVSALDAAGETIDSDDRAGRSSSAGDIDFTTERPARRSLRAVGREAVPRRSPVRRLRADRRRRSSPTPGAGCAPCGSRPRAARPPTTTSAASRCGASSSHRP